MEDDQRGMINGEYAISKEQPVTDHLPQQLNQPLAYESQEETAGLAKLYFRVALVCGATPLLVGVSTTIVFLLTLRQWLAFIGILTVLVGLFVLLIGVVALVFCVANLRHAGVFDRAAKLRVFLVVLLMLSNFPAA